MATEPAQDAAAETPLAAAFHDAQKLYLAVTEPTEALEDGARRRKVTECTQAMMNIYRRVLKARLFASNETIDDLTTVSVKYLLVPHYLSELFNQPQEDKGMGRLDLLKRSSGFAKQFMKTCHDLYELLSEDDATNYERLTSEKPQRLTPGERRDQKIAAMRRRKAAQARLDQILATRERLRKEGKLDDDTMEEDSYEREYWLTMVQRSVLQSLDTLKSNGDELPMAEMMEARKRTGKAKQDDARFKEREERGAGGFGSAPAGTGATAKKGQLMYIGPDGSRVQFDSMSEFHKARVSTIDSKVDAFVNRRENVIRNANPWTYTPEEAFAREQAQGMHGGDHGVAKPQEQVEKKMPDEMTEAEHNIWQMQQRQKDDFSDSNQFGVGNPFLRPWNLGIGDMANQGTDRRTDNKNSSAFVEAHGRERSGNTKPGLPGFAERRGGPTMAGPGYDKDKSFDKHRGQGWKDKD